MAEGGLRVPVNVVGISMDGKSIAESRWLRIRTSGSNTMNHRLVKVEGKASLGVLRVWYAEREREGFQASGTRAETIGAEYLQR